MISLNLECELPFARKLYSYRHIPTPQTLRCVVDNKYKQFLAQGKDIELDVEIIVPHRSRQQASPSPRHPQDSLKNGCRRNPPKGYLKTRPGG